MRPLAGRRRRSSPPFLFFFFLISLFPATTLFVSGEHNFTSRTLDSVVHKRALDALAAGGRTGVLYPVALPPDLAGVEATVIRLRAGGLERSGTSSGGGVFSIPPGVVAVPFERRLGIVYENLGNLSSAYYIVPNHSLVAPVVGILAFNQSIVDTGIADARELHLVAARGRPITVSFPPVELPPGVDSAFKCVTFDRNGAAVSLVDAETSPSSNVCRVAGAGHFGIVVPSLPAPPSSFPEEKRRLGKWWVVAAAGGGGMAGIALVASAAIWVRRAARKKNMKELVRQAEDGEALGYTSVGNSKMPIASMMRTQPLSENRIAP